MASPSVWGSPRRHRLRLPGNGDDPRAHGRPPPHSSLLGTRLKRKQTAAAWESDSADSEEEEDGGDNPRAPDVPTGRAPIGLLASGGDPATSSTCRWGDCREAGRGLAYWSPADHPCAVTVAPSGIRVVQVASGPRSGVLPHPAVKSPGHAGGDQANATTGSCDRPTASATALIGNLHRGSVAVPRRAEGGALSAGEPPSFSDDFMRTSDEPGGWETHGGTWETAPVQNPDMGANPFSYKVRAELETATATPATPTGTSIASPPRSARETAAARWHGVLRSGPGETCSSSARGFWRRCPTRGMALPSFAGWMARAGAGAIPGGLLPTQWYRVMVKGRGPLDRRFC